MKFPKTLYVRYEKEGDEEGYYLASKEPDGGDGERVAVYKLEKVKHMKITEELI